MTKQTICERSMFTQKNWKVENEFGDKYYMNQVLKKYQELRFPGGGGEPCSAYRVASKLACPEISVWRQKNSSFYALDKKSWLDNLDLWTLFQKQKARIIVA